ncbi:MAG: hydro-lyase, Fe-S type, tartrate/fumarate subfamily [Deltaproteobacteria bacterium]|nr:hydro-lyase, Fe-S type, tartrate/fumarate subfamily [Deltaproteobacteria bacterium]
MTPFDYKIVEETAKELYIRALKILPPDVREALKKAAAKETYSTAKEIFQTILSNVEVSDQKDMLICQDTGLPIYLVKVGSNFPFDGAKVSAALKEGAKRATLEHPFRGSSTHPITRINPQTSVGEGLPIVYWDFVADSDCLDILMIPKGSGSENMSAMKMFIPADGVAAVKKFVVDTVLQSGSNPCPPGIIGVGIGGTADLVTKLAKEAIARPVGSHNHDPLFAKMEDELYEAINSLGIGPMGLGGAVTTLAVHIEWAHTHITQNPVAVNTQCWPARRARGKIYPNGKVEYGF